MVLSWFRSRELLELERSTLDGIAASHPRVWDVVRAFHEQRQNSSLDSQIRATGRA